MVAFIPHYQKTKVKKNESKKKNKLNNSGIKLIC